VAVEREPETLGEKFDCGLEPRGKGNWRGA